ncbi:extracellular alpha-1,4-glucan glucosidase [Fusarium heterosporum]|uniref:Extracellular alpha-1,4-glucan glucosidase n=1 Tax=Fusarium heterosporum TaxID=42747 RepID=A0A8H5U142_FUSHE|nr:extracellular alpha-1,4-glucan glucosidase [Fusarium heterosporum]
MDNLDMPPAPTPPVNNMGVSSNNSDRTANLLNLLKFSGSGGSQLQNQVVQAQARAHGHGQQQTQQYQDQQQESQSPQQLHRQLSPELPLQQLNPFQQHAQQGRGILQSPLPAQIHQPSPSSADPTGLLAALMRGAHEADEPKQQQQAQQQQPFGNGSPPADTRSYLLNLLNRPKPSQGDQQQLTEASRSTNLTPQSPENAHAKPAHYQGAYQQQYGQHQHQHGSQYSSQQHRSADSYVDAHAISNLSDSYYPASQEHQTDASALFHQLLGNLAQSSPQSQSHSHAAQSPSGPPFQILKKDSPAASLHSHHSHHSHRLDHSVGVGSERAALPTSPHQIRRKAARTSSLQSHPSVKQGTPPTSEFENHSSTAKETVAEAVEDIAEQADSDARQALERAEYERAQAEIAQDLDEMLLAKSEKEFEDSAQVAARAIQAELDRSENEGLLEDALPPDVAETVRDIVDEAAQGVADSWESADQDEIVVIEEKETPPVKVFNFPMKPWISITLQEEGTEPRPLFRDDTIMDIARLKKEFDQIDRNLYTATENYMAYGMSKQGGLRVIRQEDGKDAKIFTDTKDRIFNVAMSVTPSDHEGAHREAIIGTGISGTVYWVQIRDGDKDHIEDAHMEQYGFALPPMSSQEGDAPGGVLKTRARTSTIHPEYFAVGRGKSINLIWPSYILQNNLFKPGHDRVVDTETLAKQCSLKINTGKAGKDFTFSQDDSVIVSLDKSGRVKFWDVRDLTAVKEGSDPRAPMPAQTSLEVKEPLMTLATTPEGEKAWPTSVLLLDKQRPYQKRCALRYMIVGMKQNHTLQLWDLALGKPVQEFNLPHSKESDAVCSVMYHSATGMIVIGHPTRNSIYFAHLSAPKYNLKSVSQAEYIQRLIAQDTSIPQPDSTAVISGVREYSFANRGILRSLDILGTPAMVQDADEPTLFELYAMHSKGVACLLVKQTELGWSKDNKVLDAVDAVAQNVVTVSKLKAPQPAETPAPVSNADAVRIVNRASNKENIQPAAGSQAESVQRGPESTPPVKVKSEPKEAETSVQSAKESQSEKPERKSRKKKNAANQGDTATNGATPRAGNKDAKSTNNAAAPAVSTEALDAAISGLESRLNLSVGETLKSSFKNLQGKIDDDVRVRDENFNQHQLKLLDMVSEVLNENTQKVLEALIHHQFTELVIPAIGDKAGAAVTDLLENKLQPHLASSVQKEIQSALPHALGRSLRSNDFVKALSDRVGNTVATSVQQEVLATLTQRLTPTFTNIATQASQRVASELHQQYHDQFEYMKSQHATDASKIDQLVSHVGRLTEMISTMSASQAALQAEFLKFKQQPVHELSGIPQNTGHGQNVPHHGYTSSNQHHPQASHPASHTGSYHHSQAPSQAASQAQQYMGSPQYMRGSQQVNSPQASQQASDYVAPTASVSALAGAYASQRNQTEPEADHDLMQRIRIVEQAIQEGRFQDAMIQWIQSGREEEIFRRCLSRFPPSKFENLPPLMLLVVIATISKDLKPNARLKEEVEWIEMALRAFAENLPAFEWEQQGARDVIKSTTQTMQLLIGRIQPLIGGMQDGFPTDPFLANLERAKLEWIIRTSEHVLDTFGAPRRYE